MISTTKGDMDEATLILHEDTNDNDNELTSAVEYCMPGCSGAAHLTGIPDSEAYFCRHHIHRSVHVHLKQGPGMLSETGEVG